jgi:hypothetical protein
LPFSGIPFSKIASIKDSILKAIRSTTQVKHAGGLAKGKKSNLRTDVSLGNVLASKRIQRKLNDDSELIQAEDFTATKLPVGVKSKKNTSAEQTSSNLKRKGKGKRVAKVGDFIPVSPELFDGD